MILPRFARLTRTGGRCVWTAVGILGILRVVLFNVSWVCSKIEDAPPSPVAEKPLEGQPKEVLVDEEPKSLIDDVRNSTLGFEKIFVVSLPERTDRRDRLLLGSKVSGFNVDFIDGIHGEDIVQKTLPANYWKTLMPSNIGAWRAHVNALSEIVNQDLSSALIMEDDVDWDIRLKSILQSVAVSSNILLQSSTNASQSEIDENSESDESRDAMDEYEPPSISPYGDEWDVMWLGHCEMHLPRNKSSGILLQENDETVPQHRFLRSFIPREVTPLVWYPQHTRAVFKDVREGTCSLAYAVTQSAARRMLYQMGIEKLNENFDLMLRGWCEQEDSACVGVLPQLFDHYRREGSAESDSDNLHITGAEGTRLALSEMKPRERGYSPNIRWSVQQNLGKLVKGEQNLVDQYPDSPQRRFP
ncbi:MAG: hypothetical protein M1828_005814 [Chrysothrix sp. TS-e1954]|nr:MAG: hypothetical protein M1828_005814 [Chrysothrix sp. TS-e1954]